MLFTTMNAHRRALLLGAGVGAALISTAVAFATIPDSNGVIHGCYKKSGGALRVIDNSVTNCASSETSLNWSIAGQQGPPGQQGPTGPPGISEFQLVYGSEVQVSPGTTEVTFAQCPEGMTAIAGGFAELSDPVGLGVNVNLNDGGATAREWVVRVTNNGSTTGRLIAQASCAIVAP